jgi:hypothetical protein
MKSEKIKLRSKMQNFSEQEVSIKQSLTEDIMKSKIFSPHFISHSTILHLGSIESDEKLSILDII